MYLMFLSISTYLSSYIHNEAKNIFNSVSLSNPCPIQNVKHKNIQKYNVACCFVWVWNFVCLSKDKLRVFERKCWWMLLNLRETKWI